MNKRPDLIKKGRRLVCGLYLMCGLMLFSAGCGSTQPALSVSHLNAIEFNTKAEAAFKKGDYKKSLLLYKEALRINRSIENNSGTAINLINMAEVYRKLGEKDKAAGCVDEILTASLNQYDPLYLSEAAFVKSLMSMDKGDYVSADVFAEKALTFCKNVSCRNEGKIYNLKARAALYKKDFNAAADLAAEGLRLNNSSGNVGEAANSMRTIAEAKAMNGEYDEAAKFYSDALAMDKSLGLGKKVLNDLMAIGNLHVRQGRCDRAFDYFGRALQVAEASGDKDGIDEAKRTIEKCQANSGKK